MTRKPSIKEHVAARPNVGDGADSFGAREQTLPAESLLDRSRDLLPMDAAALRQDIDDLFDARLDVRPRERSR